MIISFRFPVPEIPPGWQPDPRRVWAADKENIPRQEEPPREAQSHAQWKRSKISADQVSKVGIYIAMDLN